MIRMELKRIPALILALHTSGFKFCLRLFNLSDPDPHTRAFKAIDFIDDIGAPAAYWH